MKSFLALVIMLLGSGFALCQTAPAATQSQTKPATPQQREQTPFEVSEYGVDIQADPRLILVMAALDAAGFDSQPGREPSAFRAMVKRDLVNLNPDLRGRLQTFYQRNILPSPATPAEQASRYVTLALALGPTPGLEAPERTDDLPGGLLEVLDFAPLVREFYRTSGIEEKMVTYVRAYQSEGDRLRKPTTEMVRGLLTYLHTRPITSSLEKVEVKPQASEKKKQGKTKAFSFREKERRFLILPDLMAPRGAINFRVILDDYYAIIPEGTDPSSSELRRAYLQYVIDALVLRFNKDIATRREQIKQLLDERQKAGNQVSPDVFLSVSRSLVAAADARFDEVRKTETLARSARSRLDATKDEATRISIVKETQAEAASIADDTIARLADEYEKGAVLSFYFAEQLKGIETSGFDIANFFVDMITSFDAAREMKRPAEYAEARQRSINARQARQSARRAEADVAVSSPGSNPALVKDLAEIEDTLKLKDYNTAEIKLKEMLTKYPREPRIFFALGQTASLAASDATDEQVQTERLSRALTNYRFAIMAASPDSDKALLSRAHESMGRINAFLDNHAEALKEFEAAIQIGDVRGGAYKEALEGKKKLSVP